MSYLRYKFLWFNIYQYSSLDLDVLEKPKNKRKTNKKYKDETSKDASSNSSDNDNIEDFEQYNW